jgi:hypothetical protein
MQMKYKYSPGCKASVVSTINIDSIKTKIDDLQRSIAAIKSINQDDHNDADSPPDDNNGDSFSGRQRLICQSRSTHTIKTKSILSAINSSSARRISFKTLARVRYDRTIYDKLGLDSHADTRTIVLGSICLVLKYILKLPGIPGCAHDHYYHCHRMDSPPTLARHSLSSSMRPSRRAML